MKASYWFYAIFAICFLGFSYLEDNIRANYSGQPEAIRYFLGVVPNFLPATGMPSLLYVILPYLLGENARLLHTKNIHWYVIGFTQFGLIAWEFNQIIAPNGTFDWHDILWTIIGGLLFFILLKIIVGLYGPLYSKDVT